MLISLRVCKPAGSAVREPDCHASWCVCVCVYKRNSGTSVTLSLAVSCLLQCKQSAVRFLHLPSSHHAACSCNGSAHLVVNTSCLFFPRLWTILVLFQYGSAYSLCLWPCLTPLFISVLEGGGNLLPFELLKVPRLSVNLWIRNNILTLKIHIRCDCVIVLNIFGFLSASGLRCFDSGCPLFLQVAQLSLQDFSAYCLQKNEQRNEWFK